MSDNSQNREEDSSHDERENVSQEQKDVFPSPHQPTEKPQEQLPNETDTEGGGKGTLAVWGVVIVVIIFSVGSLATMGLFLLQDENGNGDVLEEETDEEEEEDIAPNFDFTDEQQSIVDALVEMDLLMRSGSISEVREYLSQTLSEDEQAEFEALSDEEVEQGIDLYVSFSPEVTPELLAGDNVEWSIEEDSATVIVTEGGEEEDGPESTLTYSLKKVDGVWVGGGL